MYEFFQVICETIQKEFSDLNEIAQVTRIVLRLLLAALLGGLLGYERESTGKSAGVRTHMLVAIGAALFMFIPREAGLSSEEVSRVLQGLIAGIGFLGAGTIIKGNNEQIRGLTSAAGIWVTAAIGVAIGMGREATAVISTVIALGILRWGPRPGPDPAVHSESETKQEDSNENQQKDAPEAKQPSRKKHGR